MKNKRNSSVIPVENIPLLQEMAYVRHKNQIVAHLEEIKKTEEREFNELRVSIIVQKSRGWSFLKSGVQAFAKSLKHLKSL